MANYTVNGDDLTDIADAIIAKAGLSGQLEFPDDFVDGIEGISTGTDVSDTTAVEADVRTGKYFHKADGSKVQGSIADQAAQTIHPSTTDQTIASGKYLTGTQTVKGVLLTNLDAGNIKKDVVVKVGDSTDDDCVTSVTGTYEGGGGAEANFNDVNFYDYDGKRLYSYSASDFANLSSMPSNPSRQGLTAQGWNWDLSNAKSYVSTYGFLDIGQTYVTSDGKTRLYITIYDSLRTKVQLNFIQTVANAVTVEWGDNSTSTSGTKVNSGTSLQHIYNAVGEYVVAISVSSGVVYLGYGTSGSRTFESAGSYKPYPSDKLTWKVELGNNTGLATSAFNEVYGLESINIPLGIPIYSITNNLISNTNVKCVVLPKGMTTYPSLSFESSKIEVLSFPQGLETMGRYGGSALLRRIAIPDTVTTMDQQYMFQTNTLCTKLTIPSSVTTIGDYFCSGNYVLKEVHMKPTTPPTIGTNSFKNTQSDLKIYVPSASLNEYKTASNWSTHASKMVGE